MVPPCSCDGACGVLLLIVSIWREDEASRRGQGDDEQILAISRNGMSTTMCSSGSNLRNTSSTLSNQSNSWKMSKHHQKTTWFVYIESPLNKRKRKALKVPISPFLKKSMYQLQTFVDMNFTDTSNGTMVSIVLVSSWKTTASLKQTKKLCFEENKDNVPYDIYRQSVVLRLQH